MVRLLWKSFFVLVFILFAVLPPVKAAGLCESLFKSEARADINQKSKLALVREFQTIKLTLPEVKEIKAIVKDFDIGYFSTHREVIEKITEKIGNEPIDAIDQAEKLSIVGNQIQAVLEKRLRRYLGANFLTIEAPSVFKLKPEYVATQLFGQFPELTAEQRQSKVNTILKEFSRIKSGLIKARYTLGESIAKLESFKADEYVVSSSHPTEKPDYTIVKLSEYPEFAMALAHKKDPPKQYGSGGVLSFPEYRDIVSNNLWLFTLLGHDLKHIHFANSHPMAGASIFRATRSKNYFRYFAMAILYEGVDTVQYNFERAIARRFNRLGYTLEEAMVHLASANKAEIMAILSEVGVSASHPQIIQLRDWKPTKLDPEASLVEFKTPEKLEDEIISFFAKSIEDLTDPSINYFMRPELLPEGTEPPPGLRQIPGEELHF